MGEYRTVLIDPPWQQQMTGRFDKSRHHRATALPYSTLSVEQLKRLPVGDIADTQSHLWLWTTNQFLASGFELMEHWGYRHLCPITWVKPSGLGAWWVHRTQVLLMGYRGKLDMRSRLHPNVLFAPSSRHSRKPTAAYDLIEAVSHPDFVEVFARNTRPGWASIGNEVGTGDIMEGV